MGFDLLETSGLEILFISPQDPAIDWDATKENCGFSKDDYTDDPSEDRAKKLIFRAGDEPTEFYLSIPDPVTFNKILREFSDVASIQQIARTHLMRAENLKKGGKVFKIERKKGIITKDSENAIPPQVLLEIGNYLFVRGGGLDNPLPS